MSTKQHETHQLVDYAWPTVADYEKDVGFPVNQAFKMAWNMARTTNSFFNPPAGHNSKEEPAPMRPVAPEGDPFLQGVCVALQAITAHGDGVIWREIVEAAGVDELLQFAAHIEPEEWELAGFSAFAKAEMGRDKPKKLASPAQPAAMPTNEPPLYYLQDTRGFVGNCPLWWVLNGNGYTTDLRKAQKYTLDEAMRQHRCRESDLPWLCSEIDVIQRPTIDVQDMHKIRSKDDQRKVIEAAHKMGGAA